MEREHPAPLADLLARFLANGDEKAMEELVRRTQPKLLATARRIAGSADAEDAVQTAYHSLLRMGKVPSDAPLMAWLLTAVVRIAYRHRATAQREHEIARRLAQETRRPSGETEELARLRREVGRLPSSYRDAVVLHYLEGLSAAEAGKLLGASEAAVWQRLHRARALLRSRLPPHFKCGLMFLPWWLADNAAAAALAMGGVMKAKTIAVAGTLLLLALLGAGVAWQASRDHKPSKRAPRSASRSQPASKPNTGPDADAAGQAEREQGGVRSERAPSSEKKNRRPAEASPPHRLTEHLGDASASALRVRVVDESEMPWCGARVWLFNYKGGNPVDRIKRETAADGLVDIAGAAPGEWQLSVHAGGLQQITTVELVGGRKGEARVVIPRQGALLEGVVRHKERGPLAEVTVQLRRRDDGFSDPIIIRAKTNEAGRYRIEVVPPGTYRPAVEGKVLGYAYRRCPDLQVVGTEPIRRDLEVGFVSLSGVVRDAVTRRPIPGVAVKLQEPNHRDCSTDAEGAYRFCDVSAGKGRLLLTKDGYELLFVDPGEFAYGKTRTLDVALHSAAVLHLHVTDEGGRPVIGKLYLCMTNHNSRSTTVSTHVTADADGHAVFRMIRPGMYDLWMQRDGSESPSQGFEIRAGANTVHFQLQPQPDESSPMLKGTVRDATTNLPVPGVSVFAKSYRVTAVTDDRGEFQFVRLTSAEEILWVSKDGYGFRKVRTAKLEKGTTQSVEVRLEPGATLKLSIKNSKGEPPTEPVLLMFYPANAQGDETWNATLEVDENGRAAYKCVPPGKYRLVVVSDVGTKVLEVDIPLAGASVDIRLR